MFNRVRMFMFVILVAVAVVNGLPVRAQEGDEPYAPEIDPANFVTGVDNAFLPLTPGTRFVYEGESDGETERIEVVVLHRTREVLGIPCVVVRDTVWEDGELVEDTFDWFAQDVDGNVWYMGEDVKDYEDGEVVSTAGSWEAGVDGALPGIVMWAEPQVGEPYRQEYYVGEAEDMAQVIALDGTASVAFGDFDGLLIVKEWNPLEPGVTEHKVYAAGIGLILEETVEGGEGRIELTDIETGLEDDDLDEMAEDDVDDDMDDDEDEHEDETGDDDEEDDDEDEDD
jgi:hypothetical protein